MPKFFCRFLFLSFLILLLFTVGCKHKPPIATKFYEHYQNKVYNDFDTTAYYTEFKHQLKQFKHSGQYAVPIATYYKGHHFEPHFVNQFLFNGQLRTLITNLNNAAQHGLNPALFKANKIEQYLDTIEANRFKKITDFYPVLARLELQTATSLLAYNAALQYGMVNPHNLYRRYDIPVKRPDSTLFNTVYQTNNLQSYLEQIQPKSPAYLALKNELANLSADTTDSLALRRQTIIKINMERLRWNTPAKDSRYLWVNIPAFKLQWVENNKAVFDMKVCVGQPKPAGYDTMLLKYFKTKKIDDKPLNHETTILCSRINTIQLNPNWNIPASIAQNEIYYSILKDPDYLVNNNMRVYFHEKRINRPDTIRWRRINRQKMPYTFKQDASDLNALGKFKFIFDNESSIYLHDTPNKKAFLSNYRAVSHGCVRVDDPLKLTEALVNDTNKVDNIRMEVGLKPLSLKDTTRYKAIQAKRAVRGFELKSKYLGLKPDMQLFIDYYTCMPDENGKLVYYNDVYRMDDKLEKAMSKYLSK
ncbi:L,D-transpeptidase-like protein [Mucilaginibacter gracilis]|uniref:L,D-transpeptidase-like protein n=1 Tax=Mucilaginibacter gracilis TaxID=423350 RepID=A0A495J199_9SPHI|nr:L,D-transpeptidase family protein [Mucilaginibacter gracilis]RKR82492.1 L,D-transpeptidase-like protein [Mucilaginibacter gracilis]